MNTNITNTKFIGARIKISRENNHFTRKKLAEIMCLSGTIVGKWERGNSNPSTAHLVKLSRILGVSFEWLATGINDNQKEEIENITEQEQYKIKVAKVSSLMAKMTIKQQDSLINFLDDILT